MPRTARVSCVLFGLKLESLGFYNRQKNEQTMTHQQLCRSWWACARAPSEKLNLTKEAPARGSPQASIGLIKQSTMHTGTGANSVDLI